MGSIFVITVMLYIQTIVGPVTVLNFIIGLIIGSGIYNYAKVYFGWFDGAEQEQQILNHVTKIIQKSEDSEVVVTVMKTLTAVTFGLYFFAMYAAYAMLGDTVIAILLLLLFTLYSYVVERRLKTIQG